MTSAVHALKNEQKLCAVASVRPYDTVNVSDSGLRRRGVVRVKAMLAPVSCRRYTLYSDRRSPNTDTVTALLGERNAGRRTDAPR
jgi:hypothetical protein